MEVYHANTGKSGSDSTVHKFNSQLSNIIPFGLSEPIQIVEHNRRAFFPSNRMTFLSKPDFESFHKTRSRGGMKK